MAAFLPSQMAAATRRAIPTPAARPSHGREQPCHQAQLQQWQADQHRRQQQPFRQYTYDTSNNKTAVQNELSKTWSYTFDSSGNTLTATDPLSNVTTSPTTATTKFSRKPILSRHVTVTNTYDTCGQSADEHGRALAPDELCLQCAGQRPARPVLTRSRMSTTRGYDTMANCTSVTDANSHATTVSYNGLGWKTGTTDALSHSHHNELRHLGPGNECHHARRHNVKRLRCRQQCHDLSRMATATPRDHVTTTTAALW